MDTPLPDNAGVSLEMYGNEEFSRDAMEAFPELRSDLALDTDLLHPQMGTLAAAVRNALSLVEMDIPVRVCAFLDVVLKNPRAMSEIENAVAISFVEANELRITKAGRDLLERMPERVRQVLLDQEKRGGAQ